jgi:hypothetical protein
MPSRLSPIRRVAFGEAAVEISGSGGLSPLRFSLAGGALPKGLSLDPDTGLIAGEPEDAPGAYEAEIAVTSALGETRGTVRVELRPRD